MRLKSGESVIDRQRSHMKPEIALLVKEGLSQVSSENRNFFVQEVEFNKPIGQTTCVPTDDGDQVLYAVRPKRFGRTRFVLNRQPEMCSSLVVILKRTEDNNYVLISAFIGHKPQPEPWDQKHFSQQPNPQVAERLAVEFWSTHALVWGSEEIIPGTEMEICPW